jgi:NTP pyrophosphatase (non-canonical NTP hydrolase)
MLHCRVTKKGRSKEQEMHVEELTKNLADVLDLYAKRFSIERSPDWYLIKLQEELGELSSAFLKMTGRARKSEETPEEQKKNLEDELADVLAMTLLFAKSQEIDPAKAIERKWFKHLEAAKGNV